jgi:hypothetical protein
MEKSLFNVPHFKAFCHLKLSFILSEGAAGVKYLILRFPQFNVQIVFSQNKLFSLEFNVHATKMFCQSVYRKVTCQRS